MNIHFNPAILVFTNGTRVLTHPHMNRKDKSKYPPIVIPVTSGSYPIFGEILMNV